MTAYTGVVRSCFPRPGELFPLVNPHAQQRIPGASVKRWEVFEVELTGTAAAIGTDSYTFTLLVAPRGLVVVAGFIVDPVGLGVDTTNYNTFALKNGATTLCSVTTAYGVAPHLPREIPAANTVANRTLAAGDTVTLVVTGTSAGVVINHNTRVYVVCYWA